MGIVIEGLNFAYDNQCVFSNFGLEIPERETLCIMGESGCGKTTLLKLLTGSLVPQSGTIRGIDGKCIGMVFQENRLCEDFTAALNVKLGCDKNWDKTQKARIQEHLTLVGLEEAANRRVSELSGGMKRRVAIVRAMMSDSEILIMDEPLKGLDEKTKKMVISYIKEHAGERTLLLVTHDRDEVEQFGGNLCVLSSMGKVSYVRK